MVVLAALALTACTHQFHCLSRPGVFRLQVPADLAVVDMPPYGVDLTNASSGEWIAWVRFDVIDHGCQDGHPPEVLRALIDPSVSVAARGTLVWHPASGGPGSFLTGKRTFWGVPWILDPTQDAKGACLLRLDARSDLTSAQEKALRELMERITFQSP